LTATYPYRPADIRPNLVEFMAVVVLMAVGAFLGYLLYQRKILKLMSQRG